MRESGTDIDSIRIKNADGVVLLLERSEEGWFVGDGKARIRADDGKTSVLVSALSKRMEIGRFISDNYDVNDVTQQKKFGLDKPTFELTVSGKWKVSFAVGAPKGDRGARDHYGGFCCRHQNDRRSAWLAP